MTTPSPVPHSLIIDAHLDLAYNALEVRRDYNESVQRTRAREADTAGISAGPCTVGLPELIRGRVGLVFGTIFVEPASRQMNPAHRAYHDEREANAWGMAQLDFYWRWQEQQPRVRVVTDRATLASVVERWRHPAPGSPFVVGIVPLMEGADPVLEPKELERWYERGVRIVGPAWDTTRYAGGTWAGGRLSNLGRELLAVMAELGIVLDVSHLSHESLFEALDVFEGAHVIASHSNPHRFVPTARHLPDAAIERIAERNGVIGIVPYNRFLRKDWSGRKSDVTLDDVVRMIDHVCQVTGSARHVGIGSDFDGGVGLNDIPRELDSVRDHHKIGDELLSRGFASADVDLVMAGNWLRMIEAALPA